MAISREISNFERGMLVGIPIGAIAGPSIALVLFVLIVCYDLGRPRIVDVGQKLMDKYLGIDVGATASSSYSETPSRTSNISDEEKTLLAQLLSRLAPNTKTPSRNEDKAPDE